MATEICLRAMVLTLGASLAGTAAANGLNETVGQLLHRDAQEAIAGSAPLPPVPPRLPPEIPPMLMAPPPLAPAAAPVVTAIYGAPGQLSVVLQMDGQRVVLDQRTGKPADAALPMRLVSVSGSCARVVLAARQAPTTLCVASSFGLAQRSGGMQ